jgi:hypothetical protein
MADAPTITFRLVQPNEMPRGNEHLEYAVDDGDLQLDTVSDGTTTVAQVRSDGDVIGHGVARRRKGDPRDAVGGQALAAARALRDAAVTFEALATERLGEV